MQCCCRCGALQLASCALNSQLLSMQSRILLLPTRSNNPHPHTQQAITRLELQLADMAITQGKALVIAINKSDAVPGGPAVAQDLQTQVAQLLEDRFLPAGRLPVLLMSAQEGEGTRELLDAVVGAYTKWNTR